MAARKATFLVLVGAMALAACGGGGGGGSTEAPPTPLPPPPGLVSGPTPFAAGCSETGGTVFVNAEVEPSLAVDPANASHLLAM